MEFARMLVRDLGLGKDKDEKIKENRYVISCDPFMNPQDLLDKGINTFIVYDKVLGRITETCHTKRTFQEFVDKTLLNKIDAKSYFVSNKFIGDNGRPKTISEIRNRA